MFILNAVWLRVKTDWRVWGTAVILAVFLLLHTTSQAAQAHPSSQELPPNEQLATAQALLDAMTVPERVGQLFLVNFEGDRATLESDIANLITNYHVGGVVLSAENDNITGYGDPTNVLRQTTELINDLQNLALVGEPVPVPDISQIEEGVVPPTRGAEVLITPIPLYCRSAGGRRISLHHHSQRPHQPAQQHGGWRYLAARPGPAGGGSGG